MLASIKATLDADLQRAFYEQGETATIMTQSNVPVVADARTRGGDADDLGIMPTADLVLTVRTSGLTVTPVKGATVVFKAVTYRIDQVQQDQDDNAILLYCNHLSE